MPTSDPYNIQPILAVINRLKPKDILDVGCGFGKYGVLMREYLDVWFERLEPREWEVRLTGIEAFRNYRNPIHDYIYNEIHYAPAQHIMPKLGRFDVILIADVIEHLDRDEAQELVRDCLDRTRLLIISTPIDFYAQEDICSNDFERHRCHFSALDLPEEANVHQIRAVSCHIYFASYAPLELDWFKLTEPADIIYMRALRKLGVLGAPFAFGLRAICRLVQ